MRLKFNRATAHQVIATMALAIVAGSVYAQDIKNSLVTVEQLLTIDNEQALRKAREEATRTGLLESPESKVAAKIEEPLPSWSVKSISGTGTRLTADLLLNDQEHHDIAPGATVGQCRVTSIADACVSLAPSKKKLRAGVCPAKVCWTGNEIALEARPPQSQPLVGAQAKPMPSPLPSAPLPLPATSVGGVRQPVSAPSR